MKSGAPSVLAGVSPPLRSPARIVWRASPHRSDSPSTDLRHARTSSGTNGAHAPRRLELAALGARRLHAGRSLKRAHPHAEIPVVQSQSPAESCCSPTSARGEAVHSASTHDAPLAALLDAHFDGTPGVIEEFPLLVGGENRRRCKVISAGGEYLAHAAWRPVTLRTESGRVDAAGIGLVTTHADHRDRGLASQLVEACVEEARAEGADLAFLFSAPRQLYARLGFVPAGRERLAWVSGSGPSAGGGDAYRVRPRRRADDAGITVLLRSTGVGADRTSSELSALLEIPGTEVWVCSRRGVVRAYCVVGKGRDLRGVVHEWAGEDAALAHLLSAVAERASEPIPVLGPASRLPPGARRSQVHPLALMRILRPAAFGTDDPARAFGAGEAAGARDLYIWGLDSV